MPDPLAGYTAQTILEPGESAYDMQGHLNNAAIVGLFSELRMFYMREIAGGIRRHLVPDGVVVGVRDLFVRYESEGMPGEQVRGGCRIVGRSNRAYLFDEIIAAGNRVIARAAVVECVIDRAAGKAIEVPAALWEWFESVEGRSMPVAPLPVPRLDWSALT
jgi:acyl-CoA thioesterase FadM